MIEITKASGDIVPFDAEKLRRSLKRVGTQENLINQIVNEVYAALTPGMSTRTIYQIAFRILRSKSRISAAKYHLKRAIMHLGISGYPFEKYFSELLSYQGYQVQTNQTIRGRCVSHEVDVLAKKDKEVIFVECKYHHRAGIKCDVTIALYFKARFTDIQEGYTDLTDKTLAGWLVTNTRFSSDAMQYGRCAGLHLIGWDYPETGSLVEIIETTGLYPITCISNLTKGELNRLIDNKVVLCKSLMESPDILDQLRIPLARKNSILQQCKILCEHIKSV
ncbi:MAG: restriction endonuclease [Gammaproteobacteria bacterium]|nr:restriction endonuclease [Gammaproteobacteria bacterium]